MTNKNREFDSTIENVVKPFFRDISFEKLQMSRNLAFASAGTALVMLLAASQIEAESAFLSISVASFSVAIPLLLVNAGVAENHMWGGPSCFPHFSIWLLKPTTLAMLIAAYLSLFVGICCFLLFVSKIAGLLFLGSSVFGYSYSDKVQRDIAGYLNSVKKEA